MGYHPGIALELLIDYNTSSVIEIMVLLLSKYSKQLLSSDYNFIGLKTHTHHSHFGTTHATVIVLINEFVCILS
jgi:hypothetical protein